MKEIAETSASVGLLLATAVANVQLRGASLCFIINDKAKAERLKGTKVELSRGGSRIFLRRGAPLRNDITDTRGRQIKANTKKALSQGGGVRTLPLGPPLTFHYQSRRRQ